MKAWLIVAWRRIYADFCQSLIPVVMSGIIAVYGLVIAVLIAGAMAPPPTQHMSLYTCVFAKQCFPLDC
jgi:hypothetical protein